MDAPTSHVQRLILDAVSDGPRDGVPFGALPALTGQPGEVVYPAMDALVAAGWLHWRDPRNQRRLLLSRPWPPPVSLAPRDWTQDRML